MDKIAYKKLLAQMESNNNPRAVNSIGALGLYQFMPTTLNSLQVKYNLPTWTSKEKFLNNVDLQQLYEDALIMDSLDYIDQNNLNKYIGQVVSGSKRFKDISTRINLYGLLAGIHLAGSGNLLKFLKFGKDYNDGLTSISDYIAYFSDHFKKKTKV